jgi:hypothetical protein
MKFSFKQSDVMQRAKEYFWDFSSCCTSPFVTSETETKVIINHENKAYVLIR